MSSEFVTGGAVVAGIVTILLTLKHVGILGKKEPPQPPAPRSDTGDNGQAGEKAVSFWRMEFAANKNSFVVEVDRMLRDRDQVIREIMRQELDKRGVALRQIVREELDRRRMK